MFTLEDHPHAARSQSPQHLVFDVVAQLRRHGNLDPSHAHQLGLVDGGAAAGPQQRQHRVIGHGSDCLQAGFASSQVVGDGDGCAVIQAAQGESGKLVAAGMRALLVVD